MTGQHNFLGHVLLLQRITVGNLKKKTVLWPLGRENICYSYGKNRGSEVGHDLCRMEVI